MQKYAQTNYELVALDMDGTLLNSEHETTPYTRNVLDRAAKAGKIAALSTGRCLSELTYHIETLPSVRYVICENGACVYDTAENYFIRMITLPEKEIEFIIRKTDGMDVIRQCFVDNQSYIECTDMEELKRFYIYDFLDVFRKGSIFVDQIRDIFRNRIDKVEKINIYFTDEESRSRFCRELEGHDLLPAGSVGFGLEISPSGASKAEGLEVLCDHLHLPIAQSMAIGDGGNDLEIMKAAGLSVAMGNAINEVISLADVVTEDCDHDGAAKAIERYMMGEYI